MAKIILNVSTDIKQAKSDIDTLKASVTNLGKAFNNIKADKDLTAQIQALTKYNKSLADAVSKVSKATNQEYEAELKLERYRATTIANTKNKLAMGEEKVTRERIKNAQETTKLQIQEQKLEQQSIKTAEARRKEAEAGKEVAKGTEEQTDKTKGLVDSLMQWSVTQRLVMSGLRLLKSAIADVNETLADTEKRIIAIQRVLPENSVGDQDLANRLYDLAIEYGQSFANVSDIATNFARTGLSYADTIEATRAALLALNVAELNSTQATEGLIAVMAQFQLQASDLNNVIDELNKTADRYPVTTEKLLTALQRMGSSASIAGLSLEESIGIATTLSKATGRSGANVGTAANALIQYSTKAKALETYSKLSPEIAAVVEQYKIGAANVLDIWKALSKEINNLTYEQSEKLDVLAEYFSTGEGAGLKDELESELGDIFNDITGVFSTANTFRKNYFVALLQNMETVEEAAETARNAQGYSIKENEKEMQTYERRAQALEEHWHKIANDEQGLLGIRKILVEIADFGLSWLEQIGGIRSVLLGIIPLIGPLMSVVSQVIGLFEYQNQLEHEANLEAIELWETHKEETETLKELIEQYKTLDPQSKEYRDVEESIVKILGDKAEMLGYLTKGTDEYTDAVEANVAALLAERRLETSAAYVAAKKEAGGLDVGSWSALNQWQFHKNYIDTHKQLALAAAKSGNYDEYSRIINSDQYKLSSDWLTENEKTVQTLFETFAAEYVTRFLEMNNLTGIYDTKTANNVKQFVEKSFYDEFGFVSSGSTDIISAEVDKWSRIKTESGGSSGGGTTKYKKDLEDINGKYAEIVEKVNELANADSKVNEQLEKQKALDEAIAKAKADYLKTVFEEYLNGIEVENEISKKQQSIEEARLAVEEKRKAVKEAEYNLQKAQDDLEYARRNRSERVFNAETGMWEYQANKKNVESAQEKVRQATENVATAVKNVESAEKDVQKAIDSLTDYLKKQAIADLKTLISTGNADSAEISKILQKWFGEDEGGEWGAGIKSILAGANAGATAYAYSTSAVKNAQDALKEYQETAFYKAVSALFDTGKDVTKTDVDKIIAKYRLLGVSESAIKAVQDLVSGYVGYDLWNKPHNYKDFTKWQEYDSLITGGGSYTPSTVTTTNNGGVSYDNRTYTYNGVPIDRETAKALTLAQLADTFDNMNIVQ